MSEHQNQNDTYTTDDLSSLLHKSPSNSLEARKTLLAWSKYHYLDYTLDCTIIVKKKAFEC